MKKERALEIVQKHADWVALLNGKPPKDITKSDNPHNIFLYVSKDSKELYEEFCKENGTVNSRFDQEGGEGEGDYYHIIIKVEHPVDGVALLLYQGRYDSWNGVDWDYYSNPKLVEPVKVSVTQYTEIEE